MADTEELKEDEYKTKDTVTAAYLVYMGLDMDLEWEHGICTYFFDRTPMVERLIGEFAVGDARVEPQEFNTVFMQVRNRMYQARDEAKRRGD